jgi:hypothetical protein
LPARHVRAVGGFADILSASVCPAPARHKVRQQRHRDGLKDSQRQEADGRSRRCGQCPDGTGHRESPWRDPCRATPSFEAAADHGRHNPRRRRQIGGTRQSRPSGAIDGVMPDCATRCDVDPRPDRGTPGPLCHPGLKALGADGSACLQQRQRWSEWRDSNPRPSGPKPDALPGCATLRRLSS